MPLGANLNAAVRVAAGGRLHCEGLYRQILRPPLAFGRLVERKDGW